ncbi:ribosomal protection-like ABC-F family protein [Lactococcus nasutitermitis]|uniref:Ribosomal protection-like ABC-F family protein n=1 Tax=Lactococcus nasutitermitis TaxID=1652957 RepID=A0ABV9JCA3_9LACT|nr:ABC-F type ribosomal protection protein [Lactococcus nasutitermitis]
MSSITIKQLTFSYTDTTIFNQANINIDDSWKLGLVGRNGRGKTTLLHILQGKIKTDSSVKTNKQFIYFPQKIKNTKELTLYALQDIIDFEQWQLERELTLLDVNLDRLWQPFESLSGGEQTKCLLALLFLDKSNFPLIDEPTNHLDITSREKVANYLKEKSGFILVSHDRDFLDKVCDHILAIERQKIQLYQGNFSIYETEKKLRDNFEIAEDGRLRKDISRLKQTSLEKRDWSNQRENVAGATFVDKKVAKKQNQRAKSMEKRMSQEVENKEKLLKNIEKTVPLAMNFQISHHKRLVQFEKFSLGFDEKMLFEAIDFSLKVGEIVAITGSNGHGKSSIIKYLEGNFSGEHAGLVHLPQGLKISYVQQIFQHEGSLKAFAEKEKLDPELFLSNLRKLGMERKTFEQKIETMSQGQQKKVELAKSLSQPANLYIWDEPLNYLDVFNHEQILQVLKTFQPSMMIVEHDNHFIKEVADEIIELK